jgi:hypothetical protein
VKVNVPGPQNAFFTIDMPDYSSPGIIDARDWKSLSIVEELQKAPTGSMSLNDPLLMYDRLLRVNAKVQVSFGYKANGVPLETLFSKRDADVVSGSLERRGLSMLVMNPQGSGGDDGSGTFSCGLLGAGWQSSPVFKTYDGGTKWGVVLDCIGRLGVSSSFVQFDAMADPFNAESVERQSETDFQFLVRLSYEWRCTFHMGHALDGSTFIVFFDGKSVESAQLFLKGAIGHDFVTPAFSWRSCPSGNIQVRSYEWENEQGENGEGDNVQFLIVNGQPTTRRFTMEGDQVTVWQLDEDAVQRYVEEGRPIGPIMDAASFKDPEIKQFWKSIMQTTAPNGLGYKVTLHLMGHPELAPGLIVNLNKGFPGSLKVSSAGGPVNFIINRVSHSLGVGGYFTDAEAVDLFTYSAVGVF